MSWREAFINCFRPSLFTGIALGDWLRLLRANRFAIRPSYWFRAAAIAASSVCTSVLQPYERWRFQAKYEAATIQPPLFILGHWRSGTTLLHNLLAADDRFAFPN